MKWVRENIATYPVLASFFHIPNGGKRSQTVAIELQRQGVRAGVLDYFLPVCLRMGPEFEGYTPLPGLWIELKRRKTRTAKGGWRKWGDTSDEQDQEIEFLRDQGYVVVVAFGWEEARDAVINYLEGKEQA